MRRLTVLIALLVIAVAEVGGTAAQEALPLPATPAPAECTVAPRPLEFYQQLLGTPPAGSPTPVPPTGSTPTAAPAGVPADAAIVTAVTTTLRELMACINAGDFRRFDALKTDDFVRREGATISAAEVQDYVAFLAEPPVPAVPEQQAVLYAVREARELPDGRVSALVDAYDPFFAEDVTYLYLFARVGDRWLVDDTLPVPGEGTPTP